MVKEKYKTVTLFGKKQIPANQLKKVKGKEHLYRHRKTGQFVKWDDIKYSIGRSKATGSYATPKMQKTLTTIMNSQDVSEKQAKNKVSEFLTKYYAGEVTQEDFKEIIYGKQ